MINKERTGLSHSINMDTGFSNMFSNVLEMHDLSLSLSLSHGTHILVLLNSINLYLSQLQILVTKRQKTEELNQ